MSATRTFTPMTANTDLTTITAYTNATKFGYQDAEWARQGLDVLSYLVGHLDLGGDEQAILSSSYVAVNGARTYDLNGDTLGGMTKEAVVYYYTSNAATTVNVRVRNTTDSSNAGAISGASAATTVTREVITLTTASGIKTYQLQVTGSDAVYPVYCWGYIRIRRVPA
jgi:hypothetical protein